MYFDNSYERIKRRIDEESKKFPVCCYCVGATGATARLVNSSNK